MEIEKFNESMKINGKIMKMPENNWARELTIDVKKVARLKAVAISLFSKETNIFFSKSSISFCRSADSVKYAPESPETDAAIKVLTHNDTITLESVTPTMYEPNRTPKIIIAPSNAFITK